ncbi:MAG TPA: putative lipid II flippase FtsW [Ktedonobacteraceae bacterium]|nr:putative lipid II flippase FtsW [Ktedonobacteraceae bacterium]
MKKGRRQDQLPPIVRSPALEAVERQSRGGRQSERNANQTMVRRRNIGTSRVSFAVEDTLVRPAVPRKSLKPLSNRVRARTGLTAGWRSRVAAPSPLPVEAISEEEQKKLAELEMRLPRVAGRIDSWLLVTVLALLCIGLVMVYSASSFIAARDYGDPAYFFLKQLLWALIGVAVMLVTMRIDYRHWRRVSLFGLIIVLPLLVVVLLVGTSAYGASRWLAFGSFFSFQPSELAKLVLALYIADWLARKGNQVGTFLYGLAPFVILVGVILGLVMLENDMGTAIIIAGLATAMFFTAGANIIQFLLAMGCGGLIFLTQAFKGYRAARWDFLDPFKHITSTNLQLYQSLLALGSGGWLGLGLGESREKAGYLPLPYIDSIFAVIGEELGFIGAALIVILFMFLAFRGFRLARRTQDVYGALLSTGITTWLILQVVINIGSTTGSIPYTGVPLPFISFGGSSLVISLAAVGVLLNISRYIQEPETPALSRDFITKTLSTKTLKKKV